MALRRQQKRPEGGGRDLIADRGVDIRWDASSRSREQGSGTQLGRVKGGGDLAVLYWV